GRRKRFLDPRRVEMTLKRRVDTRRQRGRVRQRFRETHVEIAQDPSRMILRTDRKPDLRTAARIPEQPQTLAANRSALSLAVVSKVERTIDVSIIVASS